MKIFVQMPRILKLIFLLSYCRIKKTWFLCNPMPLLLPIQVQLCITTLKKQLIWNVDNKIIFLISNWVCSTVIKVRQDLTLVRILKSKSFSKVSFITCKMKAFFRIKQQRYPRFIYPLISQPWSRWWWFLECLKNNNKLQ